MSHQSTVTATVLAQCKHTECTVPKHCSGHWRFLYIRYIIHKNGGLAILRFSNEYVQSSNLSLLLNNNKIKYKKYKVLLQFIMLRHKYIIQVIQIKLKNHATKSTCE